MCGIVGIVHRDAERPVDPAVIRTMCAAIRHRGPDDEGVHVSGPVGLGMRRLSIIDLAGGRQPITNEDGSQVIVFNGEIYNYRTLQRDLTERGHRLRTSSDTETIVHLHEDRGPAAVESLRGMFAFAIWDDRAHSLLLARDRFGIKPLYYVVAPWGLAFASELKALVAAGLTSRELDWDALDTYFQLGYIPAPASPFSDVRKLPPGHWLQWRDTGELVVHQYWDLPRQSDAVPRDVEARVLEWLDESVAAHLVSDVPIAAFLSGGLDSSAVVASMALAAANGNGVPQAFTARYLGSGAAAADETSLAQELAARYGVPLNVIEIAPDVRDTFEPIIRALDEPHADDSAIPTWSLSQAVGRSHKVALTGIGGDELFAGYRRHLGLVAAERYARLPGPVRRLAARTAQLLPDSAAKGLTIDRLKRFLRVGDQGTAERYLEILSRADDALRRPLYAPGLRDTITGDAARDHFRRLERDRPRGAGRDPLASALYLDYRTYLADDILALSDRLAMAHSLEIRVPFVDHELVEKVFPLPASVKVGGWEHKRLLRRALAGRLPSGHFRAPKRGFVGPTAAWLRHELRPLLEDELSAGRTARLGYFDSRALARLATEHFSRRHNREGILWALLCFSTWHRVYVEPSGAPPYQPAHPSPVHAGALP
ncbi:MAG TPA: asparagine synthase (glutamine-hydrolyzing) [Gemmatimonadales bacterium]|nr:asparagine synthase (glutamine-hydrolyzing) [Gemmatimonadales bacterium]